MRGEVANTVSTKRGMQMLINILLRSMLINGN